MELVAYVTPTFIWHGAKVYYGLACILYLACGLLVRESPSLIVGGEHREIYFVHIDDSYMVSFNK